MNTTQSTRTDITDAFALAGLTTELSRWGHVQAKVDADRLIRVTEDDGTFYVIAFCGGKAQLEESEVRLSGRAANPATIAAVIESLI